MRHSHLALYRLILAFVTGFHPPCLCHCRRGTVVNMHISAVRVLRFFLLFLLGGSIVEENVRTLHDCVFRTCYCTTVPRSLCFHYFTNSSIHVHQVCCMIRIILQITVCTCMANRLLRMENFIVVTSLPFHAFCVVRKLQALNS